VSRRLAERGFQLGLSYLTPEDADRIEKALGLGEDRLLLRRCDCTDPESTESFITAVADRFGPLNVLACLVGAWSGGRDVEDTDDVRFERMIDANLRSAFNAARAAIPSMRQAAWGRIIMAGSRAAIEPTAGQAMYNVAKAGVIALARSIAQEVGESGITSNVVVPSVIDTPAFREAVPFADYVGWPTPDEIAAVIEFLASPESAVVNGAMIPVYGRT
jgi:NAD(P)-dependent dehydrogenase (short-subunit alcohol dehydrogenase family)